MAVILSIYFLYLCTVYSDEQVLAIVFCADANSVVVEFNFRTILAQIGNITPIEDIMKHDHLYLIR